MNPNVNYGLWVVVICQCRFISCNKRTTLVKTIDNGEVVRGVGRVHGDLYFLLNFSVNL